MDENNKQIVHAWLRQLNEQDHVTTIMITHDATEIAAADQLAKVIMLNPLLLATALPAFTAQAADEDRYYRQRQP